MSEVGQESSEPVVDLAPSVAGKILKGLGAKSVLTYPDILTHGPVSADSKRHRKERMKYLRAFYTSLFSGEPAAIKAQVDEAMRPLEGGYLSAEQFGSAAGRLAKGGRFVVWTTPTFEDRLFLWFACSALLQEGISPARIGIAEPQLLLPSPVAARARYANLSQLSDEDFEAEFDEIFYPEPIYTETAANLWETFASVSPRQLAVSVGHTRKFFPQFFVFIEDFANLFPRATGPAGRRRDRRARQALGLSAFDHDLFSRLSDAKFCAAHEVLDEDFRQKYAFLGDHVALARLRQWGEARGEGEPYLHVEPNPERAPGDTDPMVQFRYKLSAPGRALRDDGFEAGRKLPIFTTGNARTYAGTKPWVSVKDGWTWDFERFDPDAQA